MNRAPTRAATIIPPLLGAAVVAFLAWRSLRVEPVAPARGRAAATGSTSPDVTATEAGSERRGPDDSRMDPPPHELSMPIASVDPRTVHDSFSEARSGARSHEALDIPAARGTPVLAVDDGVVRKLFTSVRGGLTVYEFDMEQRYCYYYAHLDGYAPGLHEGQPLLRGDLVGYVGSTGNARADAPHLHFAVTRLDPGGKWWGGTPVDPFPLLVKAR